MDKILRRRANLLYNFHKKGIRCLTKEHMIFFPYGKNPVYELDQVTNTPDGKHKNITSTNIKNSQYFAALHYDAKSGIPHLHLVVNRIDKDGNINNCHFIGERAVAAAQAVNLRHGWKDPMEIREEHLNQITDDCMDVLRTLSKFNWTDYETLLTKRGYKVKLKRDKGNVVRGYSIRMGNSTYKSSELGTGRNLMPSKIEDTWRILHPIQKPVAIQSPSSVGSTKPVIQRPTATQTESMVPSNPVITSTGYEQTFLIDGKEKQLSIPENVYKELVCNIEVPENSDVPHEDILKVAMLLFLDYVDAATQMSESCGGGGGTGTGWGKRDDEDELERARRCAMKANWLCKPMLRVRKRN